MKIFYDARMTRIGRHDGISRYGSELAGALAKLTPITLLIYDKRQLEMLPPNIPYVMVNSPLSFWKEVFQLPKTLNKLGAEVVFNPQQIMGSMGRKYKLIFTIHDLIYFQYPFPPTYLTPPQRLFWLIFHQAYWPQRLLLNRADHVATVSETSKQEIIKHHVTDRPVDVLYNAAPALSVKVSPRPKPEIVFMGTLMPYKNAELLIKALPLLPEYRLHLTGRGTPDRLAALKKLAGSNVDRVVFWNGASDQQYAEILSTATASVSASKAEGFGLPLVEAMANGVPVICSDMPIFREVAGDAALYFDPDSPEEFAHQVRKLEQSPVRNRLIKNGHTQAALFSWDKTASKLLGILKQLHAEL